MKTARGWDGEVRSVRTAQTPSIVWPGVWRKSKRQLPNCRVSAIFDRGVGEGGVGVFAEIDAGAGALG